MYLCKIESDRRLIKKIPPQKKKKKLNDCDKWRQLLKSDYALVLSIF